MHWSSDSEKEVPDGWCWNLWEGAAGLVLEVLKEGEAWSYQLLLTNTENQEKQKVVSLLSSLALQYPPVALLAKLNREPFDELEYVI